MIKHRILHGRAAFTTIELLVIIVIMGILVTVSYLSFGAWRTRVAETEVKNDINGVISGMEDVRNFKNGYPVFDEGTEFDGVNSTKDVFSPSRNVRIVYAGGDSKGYCIDVQSRAAPGVYFFIDTTSGATATPKKGTCAGGEGAPQPPIINADDTVFVFNTAAPGCTTSTVQLPVSQPTSGGTVNWGDGNTGSLSGSLTSHTYSQPGMYTVTYKGPITEASYHNSVNATNAKCLVRVQQWANNVSPTRVNFYSATNLAYVAKPPSTVTDMSYMFSGATAFNQPLSDWDVSNVTDTSYMFNGATTFNQPLSDWDVSNVTNMTAMFRSAQAFNQPIADWSIANVTSIKGMFYGARAFNQPIGSWNTANVTDMSEVFWMAQAFNQPIASWNTTKVTTMMGMLYGASVFNQPIGSWNTAAVTDMSQMFWMAGSFNQPIGSWNTSNVTTMMGMFYNTPFNQPIGSWNMSKVTDTSGMFYRASAFNQPIGGWNLTNVSRLVQNGFSIAEPPSSGYGGVSQGGMFFQASSFNNGQPCGQASGNLFSNVTNKITNLTGMFFQASCFNGNVNHWNTSNVTNMNGVFSGAGSFNRPLNSWNTGKVTNFASIFYYAGAFDQNVSGWNVSQSTNHNGFRTNSPLRNSYTPPPFR